MELRTAAACTQPKGCRMEAAALYLVEPTAYSRNKSPYLYRSPQPLFYPFNLKLKTTVPLLSVSPALNLSSRALRSAMALRLALLLVLPRLW